MKKEPDPIPEGHKANFETLKRAARDQRLALMSCIDNKTQETCYVVCGVNFDPDSEGFSLIPLARLFDDNPYDVVTPPEGVVPKDEAKT